MVNLHSLVPPASTQFDRRSQLHSNTFYRLRAAEAMWRRTDPEPIELGRLEQQQNDGALR